MAVAGWEAPDFAAFCGGSGLFGFVTGGHGNVRIMYDLNKLPRRPGDVSQEAHFGLVLQSNWA
jgi:hypothetical protein